MNKFGEKAVFLCIGKGSRTDPFVPPETSIRCLGVGVFLVVTFLWEKTWEKSTFCK